MRMTVTEYRDAEDRMLGFCTHCDDCTREDTEGDVTTEDEYECPLCGEYVLGMGTALVLGFLDIEED